MSSVNAKQWAINQLLIEMADLRDCGLACNVQEWTRVGRKANVIECAARRREARRIIGLAIAAIRKQGR